MSIEKEISDCGIRKGSFIFTAIAVFMVLLFTGCAPERVTGAATLDFKKAAWPGVISKAGGLSGAEPWGTWSTGAVVTLEFSAPLPKTFAVHLVAGAFGPNAAKEFIASVGDSTTKFVLNATPAKRVLQFNNPGKSKTLTIAVPNPVSPKELGLSADARKLGVGFTELRIVPQ